MNQEITRQIRVYGIVQGVGFRPTVSRHATARGIRGNVCNKGPYVEIYAQGSEEAVEEFISDIQNRPPKRAAILKINVENIETPEQYTQFDIIESEKTKGEIFVSPDIAICDECKEEMFDKRIADICILLSTVPAADRALPFWIHCHMTGNVPV